MSWVKVETSITNHLKTCLLADLLGVNRQEAMGIMTCLWAWAVDHAETGEFSAKVWPIVCENAFIKHDHEKLLHALEHCGCDGQKGFIEQRDGMIIFHGWQERMEKLLERRGKDKQRKQKARACPQSVRSPSARKNRIEEKRIEINRIAHFANAPHVNDPSFETCEEEASLETTALDARELVEPIAGCESENAEWGQSLPHDTSADRDANGDDTSFFPHKSLKWFQQFWSAFDYKKSRALAEQAWLGLKMDNFLFKKILAGARTEATTRRQKTRMGLTPIYAARWLEERRWEDEPDPPSLETRPLTDAEQWDVDHPDTDITDEQVAGMDELAAEMRRLHPEGEPL